MKTESVHRLAEKKLAQLLGMVLEDSGADDMRLHDRAARLLQQWLSAPLLPLPGQAAIRCALVGEEPADPDDGNAPTIRQLLFNGQTDLKAIRGIKDCAKALSRCNRTEPVHTVAVIVYYAAIASALLFHGQRITSYSYRAMASSFETFMSMSWLPGDLWEHFFKACERAGEH